MRKDRDCSLESFASGSPTSLLGMYHTRMARSVPGFSESSSMLAVRLGCAFPDLGLLSLPKSDAFEECGNSSLSVCKWKETLSLEEVLKPISNTSSVIFNLVKIVLTILIISDIFYRKHSACRHTSIAISKIDICARYYKRIRQGFVGNYGMDLTTMLLAMQT